MSDAMTSEPTPPPISPASPRTDRIIGGLRYLLPFVLANAGMSAVFQGLQQIALPAQIAVLDESSKVGAYGLLASIGALAAAISNPVFGAISDATRSRWGRRAPWLLLTAVVSTLLVVLLAGMQTLFLIGGTYLLVMLVTGAFQAVITATVPDRVPEKRRGLVSSLAATGATVGGIYGINVAAAVSGNAYLTNLLIAILLTGATILLVIIAPDPTASKGTDVRAPREKTTIRAFFSSLGDHDFAWAFFSRVAIMVGYWTVSTYQLYTLTDYIGAENLPGGNIAGAAALLGTINLGCTALTTFIAGPISDAIGRRKVFVVIASIGVGIGALVPVFMPTFTGMIVFSIIMGLFFGAYYAVDAAIMTLVLPRAENNARDLGLLNIGNTGPQIAGPFVAAIIITAFGGYQALYVFCAVIAVISAFLILPIRKVR